MIWMLSASSRSRCDNWPVGDGFVALVLFIDSSKDSLGLASALRNSMVDEVLARLPRRAEGPSNSRGCSWNPVSASNQGLLGLLDCIPLGFVSSLRCASRNQLTASPLGIMMASFSQLGLELLHNYLKLLNYF